MTTMNEHIENALQLGPADATHDEFVLVRGACKLAESKTSAHHDRLGELAAWCSQAVAANPALADA